MTDLNLGKIETEQKLGILPYGSYRAIENRPNDLDGGLDLILPISTHLTSNVTFNPDFSQLESDPTQINISSDRELSLPERRPFFREGAELFELPLIYSIPVAFKKLISAQKRRAQSAALISRLSILMAK